MSFLSFLLKHHAKHGNDSKSTIFSFVQMGHEAKPCEKSQLGIRGTRSDLVFRNASSVGALIHILSI